MTTYTTLSNALVAVGAKPFATTVQALRDNPLAIAEGDVTAPRVQSKALAGVFLAYQAVAGTNPVGWASLSGMETIKVDFGFEAWATGNTLQLRFSNDNGSSYGSYQTLLTNGTGATQAGSGVLQVNLRTGACSGFAVGNGNASSFGNSTTLTVPSNCNAFQVRQNSGGTFAMYALAWCLGGLEA